MNTPERALTRVVVRLATNLDPVLLADANFKAGVVKLVTSAATEIAERCCRECKADMEAALAKWEADMNANTARRVMALSASCYARVVRKLDQFTSEGGE